MTPARSLIALNAAQRERTVGERHSSRLADACRTHLQPNPIYAAGTCLRPNQSTWPHASILWSTLLLPFHMLLTTLLVSSVSFPVKIVYTFIFHACCVPYYYPSMYHPVLWGTVQMINSLLRIYARLSIASSPFYPNTFLSTLSRDILNNIPGLALWWETKFYTHP
jgi:hypothetical protein